VIGRSFALSAQHDNRSKGASMLVVLKKTARTGQINFPASRKAGKIRAPIFRVLAVGDYKRVHIYTSQSEYQINVL